MNKIAKCNLLHDIINPPRCTKNLNIHYSSILNGCMNNRYGRVKFNNFLIILDSVCSSMIVMGRLVEKIRPEKDAVMQWHPGCKYHY